MKILALMMVARHQAVQRGLLLAKIQADLGIVLMNIEYHQKPRSGLNNFDQKTEEGK